MVYGFDDFTFDTQTCELRRQGALITLAPKVYQVLAYLIAHRDRLVAKDELLEQIWPNTYVDDSSVKHCIMAARRALAERSGTPRYLKTMRGQGYRFIATVRESGLQHSSDDVEALAATAEVEQVPPDTERAHAVTPAESTPPAGLVSWQRCARCQHVQPGIARFCSACGAPFERQCPHCSAAVAHAAGFCPACGQLLNDGVAAVALPDAPPQTSRSLVPPASAAGGEHKLITVLCGVVPRVAAGSAMGLEALHRLMQTVFDLAGPEVRRYAGTLQPLTGDHFLAFFGAPVAQEDHARRAVLAALGLQQRLRQPASQRASGEEATVCLALHSGYVVVEASGEAPHGTATVVGDATILTEALARRAHPGTILSSAATLRLIQDEVSTTPLPPLALEGQPTPIPVHQVLALVPAQRPRRLATAHTHSLFLGREVELALLHAHWARVKRGQGHVVGVVGEPGLGKSRLLAEFQQAISAPDISVWQGHCQSYGSMIPYLPLMDMLRAAWGITEAAAAEGITRKVQASLHAAGLMPEALAPSLLPLLSVPTAGEAFAGLAPELRKARTFEALHQVLLSHDQRQPRLIIIENLHWIDATSEAYLAALVEQLGGTPTLVVVTYRPGYRPAWLEKSYATQMTLQALEPEASRRIVHSLVGQTPLPMALEHQILAKAEGNPFFLEELAHTLLEQGRDVAEVMVPDTVQAVLAARIDRLPLLAKQLLQTAAVLGREVSVPLLQAVTALAEADLHEGLALLQAAELLYATHQVPERIYAFKHALTHEVAYSSLLQEPRQVLHRQVLAALEAVADTAQAAQIDRLARHALQGEVWDKALLYSRQAGAMAMARSAHHEAVLCYEQALTALRHVPQTRETDAQTIDVHLALRNALVPLGEFTRIFAHLRDAEVRAEAIHDTARLGRIAAYVVRDLYLVGNHERAIASGQRALRILHEDVALQVTTHLYLSYAYRALGAYQQAVAILQDDVAALTGERVYERLGLAALPAVSTRVSLVHSLTELGAFADGLIHGEEALRIAAAVGHPFSLNQAYRGLGVCAFRQGHYERAITCLEQALALCQEAHLPLAFPVVASFLGAAYAQVGRLDDALPLLEQAVTQGTAIQRAEQHALRLVLLGEGYVLAHRPQHAYPLALEALRLAQTRKEQGAQAYALRLLGVLAAHGPSPEVAPVEAAYQQAQTLAQTLGMRPLLAACHLDLGRFYRRVGQHQQAHAALTAASHLCRAMAMPQALEQALAALA